MKKPRNAAAGLLLVLAVLLAAACAGTESPQGWAAPALEGNTAYYLSGKEKLTAVDLGGQGSLVPAWTFPDTTRQDQKDLKLDAVYGEPVLDAGSLYFGSYSGRVFSINAADGQLKAPPRRVDGAVIAGPTLAGDFLAFGTGSSRLYLLQKGNLSTAPGWPENGISFGDPIWAPPVYADGVLYVATMGGDLFAISVKDGAKIWARPFSATGAIGDLTALPNGMLFVPSLNKHVYIVNMKTGVAAFDFFASDWVWTRPAVKGNTAYFGDFAGTVYALDITTGKELWSRAGQDRIKAGPAIVGDVVVVADRNPVVHFYDAATGDERNRVPLTDAGTIRADVAASPDGASAIISTTGGKLFRADPKSFTVTQIQVAAQK